MGSKTSSTSRKCEFERDSGLRTGSHETSCILETAAMIFGSFSCTANISTQNTDATCRWQVGVSYVGREMSEQEWRIAQKAIEYNKGKVTWGFLRGLMT